MLTNALGTAGSQNGVVWYISHKFQSQAKEKVRLFSQALPLPGLSFLADVFVLAHAWQVQL